eukprot:2575824-Pleurochrysis_carterae.AAC.4
MHRPSPQAGRRRSRTTFGRRARALYATSIQLRPQRRVFRAGMQSKQLSACACEGAVMREGTAVRARARARFGPSKVDAHSALGFKGWRAHLDDEKAATARRLSRRWLGLTEARR